MARSSPLERVRRICLALPGANERASHGSPAFFIRDKRAFVIYLDNHHDDGRLARASEMHSACDYDPYEGWEVRGWPMLTLLRGQTAYSDGEILAKPGQGRLVLRQAT